MCKYCRREPKEKAFRSAILPAARDWDSMKKRTFELGLEVSASKKEGWGRNRALLDMVELTSNLVTWVAKPEESQGQGHPGQLSEPMFQNQILERTGEVTQRDSTCLEGRKPCIQFPLTQKILKM